MNMSVLENCVDRGKGLFRCYLVEGRKYSGVAGAALV